MNSPLAHFEHRKSTPKTCKHPVLRGLRPARNCPLCNSVVILSTFPYDVAGEQQRVSDFSEDEAAMNSVQETSRSGFRRPIHRAASIVQSPICSSSLQPRSSRSICPEPISSSAGRILVYAPPKTLFLDYLYSSSVMSAAKTDRALSLQSHRRVKTRNQNQKPILLRQDTEEGKEKKAGRKRYAFTKPPCIQLPPHNRPLATTVANPVPASSDLPSPPRQRQNKEDRVHDEVPPQIFLRHIIIIIITFVFFCIPQNSCHFHFFFFFVVVVFCCSSFTKTSSRKNFERRFSSNKYGSRGRSQTRKSSAVTTSRRERRI